MEKALCVYCSSSNQVDPAFFAAARELGAGIARHGYGLVYGGTNIGLMGAIAASVQEHGGRVVGVIPEKLHGAGIGFAHADELIITKDMRERKATMESRATAFLGFPGGFGTLEEIFEILTLKQLGYHNKPVAIMNVNAFYDPLLSLFEHIYANNFAKPAYRQLYHCADTVEGLFAYLDTYQAPDLGSKW